MVGEARARPFARDREADVVLMDLSMPRVDGLEATGVCAKRSGVRGDTHELRR